MRVGIAGYGLAGRSFHGPLLKGCGFDIVAIATGNSTRARQAKDDFPLATIAPDFATLLKQKLDLVVIATANKVHAEQAKAAIAAGVPVVIDKPAARTAKETEEIFQAARVAAVPVTVFYNRLWDSDALTIKHVVQNGLIGKPFRLDSRFERFRPQLNPTSWRENETPENGGGLLLDLQTHLISTALDWFGPAQLVHAQIRNIRGESEDDVLLALKHESGVDSYLSASAIAGNPGPRIRLLGSEGALVIEDLDPQEALLRGGEFPEGGLWTVPTASRAYIYRGDVKEEISAQPGNYGKFYLALKDALSQGSALPISEDQVMAVARVIDKAREINAR
jgi:scyllo-inositol 2-dehydrogenase (NADP+)